MPNDVGQELLASQPEISQLSNLWQVADTEWLKRYYADQLRSRNLQEARETPYRSLARLGTENIRREIKPGHFVIATASTQKSQLISEVIQEQGYMGEPIAFVDERSEQEFASRISERWGKKVYSLTVSAGKAVDVSSQAFEAGKTVIAADSVVLAPKGRILEKPKDETDLERMLKAVRGKKIKVIVGVNALVPLKYGEMAVRLDEGAEISIRIRNLLDGEVDEYVKTNADRAMAVAGGIDFSSKSGQELIDITQPIFIQPLKLTVYDHFCANQGIIRRPVSFNPKGIGGLADYFKGAPKDIIRVLMKQAKNLQEEVERL